MKKIIVIGDSHSTLYDKNPNRNRGVWIDSNLNNVFDVRWIGPVTFWRLCRDQEKFIDFNSDIKYYAHPECPMTTKAKKGSEIIIVLGEIDVRCNILKHKPYKKTVDEMIKKIEKFISKYNSDFNFHIQSIVPTIYRANFGTKKPLFPFVGNDEERRDVTLYFNDKLKALCKSIDIGYFDIFDIYADKKQMMTPEKSDYIVHAMKTPELEERIKEYFKL